MGVLAGLMVAGLRGRVTRYAIAEESMAPALRAGEYVIAERWSGPPRRGDVVIFPHASGLDLVKRVVGLPGEEVAISRGQVHVDGTPLAEPWADGPTYPDGAWTLGAGEVFVLGDHRPASADDSRAIGPVPLAALRWRLRVRYWPPTKAGRVR